MDDKALRRTLIDVLDDEPSINAAQIGVAVENGIVTLTGRVRSPAEKVTAEQAIRRVKGVRTVMPGLAICGMVRATSDEEIACRARVAIAWHALIPEGAVTVQVENGWVTLTGTVEDVYERTEAEAAVRKLDDVVGVTNLVETRTAVQSEQLVPDLAIISLARRAHETWDRVRPHLGDVLEHSEPRLYEAAVDGLLTIVRRTEPTAGTLREFTLPGVSCPTDAAQSRSIDESVGQALRPWGIFNRGLLS